MGGTRPHILKSKHLILLESMRQFFDQVTNTPGLALASDIPHGRPDRYEKAAFSSTKESQETVWPRSDQNCGTVDTGHERVPQMGKVANLRLASMRMPIGNGIPELGLSYFSGKLLEFERIEISGTETLGGLGHLWC